MLLEHNAPVDGKDNAKRTTNASIGEHTLMVEIPPVPGEQNTEDIDPNTVSTYRGMIRRFPGSTRGPIR